MGKEQEEGRVNVKKKTNCTLKTRMGKRVPSENWLEGRKDTGLKTDVQQIAIKRGRVEERHELYPGDGQREARQRSRGRGGAKGYVLKRMGNGLESAI